MKTIYNYLLYIFYAFVMAAFYGLTTYLIVYPLIADGHILFAHALNFLLIVTSLLADKAEQHFMLRRKNKTRQNKFTSVLRALFSPRVGRISFKTSLYLFYFCILILSVVLRVDDVIDVTENFQNYILTLEYGVMFLLAVDMFIKHLIIDSKHIRDMDNGSTIIIKANRNKDDGRK